MRRFAWLIMAVLLVAVWAWSQRVTDRPHAGQSTTMAESPDRAAGDAGSDGAPLANLPDASPADASREQEYTYPDYLPPEAHDTLRLIRRGSAYPYRQDGGTFQNRENELPSQPRGYYREYTVRTPGASNRGARRLVTGGDPPQEYFYTDDHYRSFRRFTLEPAR